MGKAARLKRTLRRALQHRVLKESPGVQLPEVLTPERHELSRWHEAPEVRRATIESFDPLARLRNGLRRVASSRDEWAGIPMPLDNERLVVEPTYPKAKELMEQFGPQPKTADDYGMTIRNTFWSVRYQSTITIVEHEGRIKSHIEPGIHHFGMDLQTLGCSDAWGIEQESNAVHTLAGLCSHRQFKQYMLTGMFVESSKRSRVSYVFRRLRPTVALRSREGEDVTIMCALCLHPIAYYAGTWAGAMTPTDDVIAHLMMMRADEPLFWRRANQHPAYHPAAGL